jgi:hypothetical protein
MKTKSPAQIEKQVRMLKRDLLLANKEIEKLKHESMAYWQKTVVLETKMKVLKIERDSLYSRLKHYE